MNDLIPQTRAEGLLAVGGQDIYDKSTNLVNLRQQVGMVFQRPNPFAKTIYDNITYGPKTAGCPQPRPAGGNRRKMPQGCCDYGTK